MKSISLTISKIALFVVTVFTMNVMPFIAFAAPTDNVSGYAFSDMPNSADEDLPTYDASDNHYGGHGLGFINMSGDRYGVNLGTDGKFTGYAWSELGGYVQFNPSTFPADATDAHGAQVSESCLSGLTACSVTGWIRFISASNDPQSGGWDGWVKMSDSALWSNGVKLGAPDAAKNRQMSGYAWGGDVVGWVDFSNVKIMGDWCPNIPGFDASIPVGMVKDVDGNCVTPPRCIPPLVENPDYPPQEPACVCPGTLTAPVNGQCSTGDPDICTNVPGIQLTPADIPVGYAQPTDGSKICPETTCLPGKPCDKCWNVGGVQLTVPSQYNAVYPVNQCVIAGCTIESDPNWTPGATVDNNSCSTPCTSDSPSWNEYLTPPRCSVCNPTTPGYDKGVCPKQPIKPGYIET